MAAYTTKEAITLELGQNAAGVMSGLTDEQISNIIEQQSGVIDDYIRKVATLPLLFIPNVVSQSCLAFCKYKLWTRKAPKDIPDWLISEYKNTLSTLKLIQKGDIPLAAEEDYSEEEKNLGNSGVSDNIRWTSDDIIFNRELQ